MAVPPYYVDEGEVYDTTEAGEPATFGQEAGEVFAATEAGEPATFGQEAGEVYAAVEAGEVFLVNG